MNTPPLDPNSEQVKVQPQQVLVPILFNLDLFISLMRQAWELGSRFNHNLSAGAFAQHMRTVLETGSTDSLPPTVRINGQSYIDLLMQARQHLIPPAPAPSPVQGDEVAAEPVSESTRTGTGIEKLPEENRRANMERAGHTIDYGDE